MDLKCIWALSAARLFSNKNVYLCVATQQGQKKIKKSLTEQIDWLETEEGAETDFIWSET